MRNPGSNLGSFAILKNGGTHGALADLLASAVSMAGFIGIGQPKDKVLGVWDDMLKMSREQLILILEEEEKHRG